MAEKRKVLIVDDHTVVIEGIKKILSNEEEFEVVGSAKDGCQALSLINSLNPDIVILDIAMPGMDGIETAREIKKIHKKVRILIYSMSSSRDHITTLFREGVSGYVLKHEPMEELYLGLKTLSRGAAFYSKAVQQTLQKHILDLETEQEKGMEDRNRIATLSNREKEIFILLADGLTVKDIAKQLCISHKTVETHKYNIMDKLGLKSLAQFTKIAAKNNLIDL